MIMQSGTYSEPAVVARIPLKGIAKLPGCIGDAAGRDECGNVAE
jgi:hypothetical protein